MSPQYLDAEDFFSCSTQLFPTFAKTIKTMENGRKEQKTK